MPRAITGANEEWSHMTLNPRHAGRNLAGGTGIEAAITNSVDKPALIGRPATFTRVELQRIFVV
jgi:hypothetical protein